MSPIELSWTAKMPKLFIFDAFTLLIREKNVANYALSQCKTISLKIWLCKILDKYHVCNALNCDSLEEIFDIEEQCCTHKNSATKGMHHTQ